MTLPRSPGGMESCSLNNWTDSSNSLGVSMRGDFGALENHRRQEEIPIA